MFGLNEIHLLHDLSQVTVQKFTLESDFHRDSFTLLFRKDMPLTS